MKAMNSQNESKKAQIQLKNLNWTTHPIPEQPQSCNHYFEIKESECKCANCGMGLIGVYETKDGKPLV